MTLDLLTVSRDCTPASGGERRRVGLRGVRVGGAWGVQHVTSLKSTTPRLLHVGLRSHDFDYQYIAASPAAPPVGTDDLPGFDSMWQKPVASTWKRGARKLPAPGAAWRICLVSTDRRVLHRFDVNASGEDPLLAATVNQQYAARHDYAYILSSYDPARLYGRAYGWSKVQVLRELMSTHPEVDAFAFLDGDASINTHRRLESLLRLRFFDDTAKLFFFALDPPGQAHPAKWASWTDPIDGRTWHNEHANTVQTCGFFLVKNTRSARVMMRKWWRVPDDYPHMRMYRHLWPHCQRCWDDVIRPKYASSIAQAANVSEFNAPWGEQVRARALHPTLAICVYTSHAHIMLGVGGRARASGGARVVQTRCKVHAAMEAAHGSSPRRVGGGAARPRRCAGSQQYAARLCAAVASGDAGGAWLPPPLVGLRGSHTVLCHVAGASDGGRPQGGEACL